MKPRGARADTAGLVAGDSGTGRAGTLGGGGAGTSSGRADPLAVCKTRALHAGERSTLLGRWRPERPLEGSNNVEKLLRLPLAAGCPQYEWGIEFRERQIVTPIAPAPAEYGRAGEDWWVCLPQSTTKVLRFHVFDADRIFDPDGNCRLVREAAASPATAAAAPAAANTVAGGSAGATLALTVAAAGSQSSPIAGRSFFLPKESVESVMAKAGVAPSPGTSRLNTWALACERQAPVRGNGANAPLAASVGVAKTDSRGRTRIAPQPAGTWYVVGVAPDGNSGLSWNGKVQLVSGDNTLTLDQRNATPLN